MENAGYRHSGYVKFFDHERGFGFVRDHKDAHDYFLHVSEVQRSGLRDSDLRVGAEITFTLIPGNSKGPKCSELELV